MSASAVSAAQFIPRPKPADDSDSLLPVIPAPHAEGAFQSQDRILSMQNQAPQPFTSPVPNSTATVGSWLWRSGSRTDAPSLPEAIKAQD